MILKIKNLSKNFGSKTLFNRASFIVHKGDRIALIGQNGTGKSTLIRCIMGEEDFEGAIEVNKTIKISVMEQEKEFEKSEQTYSGYLKEKREKIEKLKQKYEGEMGDPLIYKDMDKFEEAIKKYEILCSRITEKIEESKIKKMLNELKFEMNSYNKRIIDLSVGQRTKLRLVECLCKDADFIILDEPTNHLDFKTLKWLEEHLKNINKTILVVSHDRYFLNQLVNKVVEIENMVFQKYNCGYNEYLKEKVRHIEILNHQFEVTKKEKKKLLESAKEKRRWASIAGKKGLRVKADALERQAEKLPKLKNPQEFIQKFKMNFEKGVRSGEVIFTLKDIKKSFGNLTLFDNVSFEVDRGDKIAVIGENGTGKSTLLNLLVGLIKQDEGVIIKGYNLEIGYFDQELKNIDPNQRLVNFFEGLSPKVQEKEIVSSAIKFGFPKDKLRKKIKTLSGGEKSRINFVKIMAGKSNVLLLDEPTNNLDLELRDVLEQSLMEYRGTVVFVSHDRYFIDKIATKLLVIDNKEIKIHDGNYSDNLLSGGYNN